MHEKVNMMVIAVDGFSSTGKSTLAKDIAKHYKIRYVDSGAMYRAVTYFAIEEGIIDLKAQSINKELLRKQMNALFLDFTRDKRSGIQSIVLNGRIVENEIRTMEVSNFVSHISKLDFVRHAMVEKQRGFAQEGSLVMDGRDIGTVVFPNAANKEIRAQRRYSELKEKSFQISYEEVMKNIEERDRIDQTRAVSPLKKADDAIELDNSFLSREEQLGKAIDIIEQAVF